MLRKTRTASPVTNDASSRCLRMICRSGTQPFNTSSTSSVTYALPSRPAVMSATRPVRITSEWLASSAGGQRAVASAMAKDCKAAAKRNAHAIRYRMESPIVSEMILPDDEDRFVGRGADARGVRCADAHVVCADADLVGRERRRRVAGGHVLDVGEARRRS